jgi:hypothetical protein
MTADLATTNAWLATLTALSLIELIAVTAALIFVVRVSARVSVELREFETRHVLPLMAQMQVALRDLHDVTTRVQRADDQVRAGAERVGALVGRTSAALRWPALSAWALARGVRAAVSAFRTRSAASRPSHAHAPVTPELLDEARLVSEGGHEPADAASRM